MNHENEEQFEAAYRKRLAESIAEEHSHIEAIERMARDNAESIRYLWERGNGYGGWIHRVLASAAGRATGPAGCADSGRKKKIDGALRTKVFERDAYRCVHCGAHKDPSCDRILPESKGGETTFTNLQTLCRPCNNKKGVRQ